MALKKVRASAEGSAWVTKQEVWHPGAKRYIRRRDGKPFRFKRKR